MCDVNVVDAGIGSCIGVGCTVMLVCVVDFVVVLVLTFMFALYLCRC